MAKRKVFLVDDEKDILDIYDAVLSTRFDISCFTSPTEVIRSVEQGQRPDLFVTDMKMPEMDGIGLIQKVRAHNVTTPFVLVSGFSERSEAVLAMQKGGVEMLEKPFTIEQLLTTVTQAVRLSLLNNLKSAVEAYCSETDSMLKTLKVGDPFSGEMMKRFESQISTFNETLQGLKTIT